MSASRRLDGRSVQLSLPTCAGVAVAVTLAYVGVWKLAAPMFSLFLILGTYYLLGSLALVQVVRAARMDRWSQRVGALGVVVGLAVTIFLGLRPRTPCIDFGPCKSGLTPHLLWLALGIGVVTVSLFLDGR